MTQQFRFGTAAALVAVALTASCVSDGPKAAEPDASLAPAGALRVDPALVGAGDPLFPRLGNGGYDISHYDLNLTWEPTQKELSGTVTLTAAALRDLTTFNLDLTGLVVDKVSVNDAAARFERQRAELVIAPANPIRSKERFTVAVSYHGQPSAVPYKGGRSTDVLGWQASSRSTFTSQEPYGAHGWFPCSDHPSDKAIFTIHVRADPAAGCRRADPVDLRRG